MIGIKLVAFALAVMNGVFFTPVLLNPGVDRPVVDQAEVVKKPRLVVTITGDGELSHDGKLFTDEQFTALCRRHVSQHPTGVLHLRADKGVGFKSLGAVMRAASRGGLDQVVFSALAEAGEEAQKPHRPDPAEKIIEDAVAKTIQLRESDLKLGLPAAAPGRQVPSLAPLFVGIDAKGVISVKRGGVKEVLDADVTQRQLPQFNERLRSYLLAAKAAGVEPVVQVDADGKVRQERLVDVLNALALQKVKKVTFVDRLEE